MIQRDEFREWGHKLIDWIGDYYEEIGDYPVKSQVSPGDILKKLPAKAPGQGESMDQIWEDFQQIILPGMTHWQHPGFMAYFPANTSYPSLLGEMLTAALGAQCMIWDTSPAAAELEERMTKWLGKLIGIPESWHGVIQSTASEATLCAVLTARERLTDFTVNKRGLQGHRHFRVYGSRHIHSSIEKAVKIAGLGSENFVKIGTDEAFAMKPELLEAAIKKDLTDGYEPLCVVAGIGTTGSTAIDPLGEISQICSKYGIWLHVDAAYAGTALILPEHRHMIDGMELVDSFVFNPHKWMLTNFDCSAYYVKDKESLIRTFEILPEYLKTGRESEVNNYRDWGIPLGRRFRALKLWFVIRSYGAEGIQQVIRNHIQWAQELAQEMEQHEQVQLLAPVPLNLICFRFSPPDLNEEQLDQLNKLIVARIQQSGKLYLTHTTLNGQYTIRLVAGQAYLERQHLWTAWNLICQTAEDTLSSFS